MLRVIPLITETFNRFFRGRRFATGLDFGWGDDFYSHCLWEYVDQLSGADVSKCIEDGCNRSA